MKEDRSTGATRLSGACADFGPPPWNSGNHPGTVCKFKTFIFGLLKLVPHRKIFNVLQLITFSSCRNF